MSNKPIVKLFNFTPSPIETMMWAFKNMHGKISGDFVEFINFQVPSDQVVSEFAEFLAVDPLAGGVQEFVSTVWFFDNVSRAFQQQLTRHRTAAYSIQSLRVVDKRGFADRREYLIPDDVKNRAAYEHNMLEIQEHYNSLIEMGEPVQAARGILPLNIYSPITMCINLRNLRALVNTRLCTKVQGEFRLVAEMMIEEVVAKMGEEFKPFFGAPCEQLGFCAMEPSCGKKKQLPGRKGKFTDAIKEFIKK